MLSMNITVSRGNSSYDINDTVINGINYYETNSYNKNNRRQSLEETFDNCFNPNNEIQILNCWADNENFKAIYIGTLVPDVQAWSLVHAVVYQKGGNWYLAEAHSSGQVIQAYRLYGMDDFLNRWILNA